MRVVVDDGIARVRMTVTRRGGRDVTLKEWVLVIFHRVPLLLEPHVPILESTAKVTSTVRRYVGNMKRPVS
jgi:hypothetical protein